MNCCRDEGIQSVVNERTGKDEGSCQRDQGCSDEEHDELHVLAHHGHYSPQREVSNTAVPCHALANEMLKHSLASLSF